MKKLSLVIIILLVVEFAKSQEHNIPATADYLNEIKTELKTVFP